MKKVIIRSYCEAGCDCPYCHTGKNDKEVEDCVYCQLKWYQVGEYNPKHPVYKTLKESRYCECGNLIKNN
jgi:hypothetical protein